MRLSNGQVYRGPDSEALISQLTQAQEHAAAEITRLKQLEREFRQQGTQQQAPPQTNFKNEEFWGLMDKDPQQGLDYYFSNRFGMSPDEFRSTFEHTTAVASSAEQAMEATAFMTRVPEFPGGDLPAAAVTNRLRERDLPMTANNMELVFHELVREGIIIPTSQQQSLPPNPTAAPNESTAPYAQNLPQRPLPPPNLGPGGAAPSPQEWDIARRAEGLSTPELEKLLRETGVKRY